MLFCNVGFALSLYDCQECLCDIEHAMPPPANVRAICSGASLTSFPDFDPALARKIYLLGLARNMIRTISKEQLASLPNLAVLDIRDQGDCITYPSEFDEKIVIHAEKCESSFDNKEKKEGSILDSLKKHFVAIIPSEHRPASLNNTSNFTANSTSAPDDPGPGSSGVLTSDKARTIIKILEKFHRALIDGGHTTLALIIYAIITTVAILSTIGYFFKKYCCKQSVQRGRYTLSGVELAERNLAAQSQSSETWPEPPPPEPSVLNMETESTSSGSSETLFSKSCVVCPTRANIAKQHEA